MEPIAVATKEGTADARDRTAATLVTRSRLVTTATALKQMILCATVWICELSERSSFHF